MSAPFPQSPDAEVQLDLRALSKRYPPNVTALDGVSLAVRRGEIVCLLGPSGCGKTTLLRIVAGLEQADRGELFFAGRDLADVPVHQRNFGLMFQEFALFPDKTVAQNIAFGLRMAALPQAEIAARVKEMLMLVNLDDYGQRTIFQLSGGERQRVALARSLAPRPHLLMLDEPLGSLDRTLREELMMELRAILKRLRMTALYVTHDQQEALAVADRVVVMHQGRIAQVGTPRAIYQTPATPIVATFLGFANQFPAVVEAAAPDYASVEFGRLRLLQPVEPGLYTLLIRPEALVFGVGAVNQPVLQGVVEKVSYRGNHVRVEIAVEQKWRLIFETPSDFDVAEGAALDFSIDPAACTLFPAPPLPGEGQGGVTPSALTA